MKLLKWMLVACVAASVVACSTAPKNQKLVKGPATVQYKDQVEVKYLGGGGVLLKRGDDMVMTAPYFSNITPLQQLLPTRSKFDRIDNGLPDDVNNLEAILVPGSHFYRTMDLPYIADSRAPNAVIYGGETTKHLLAPVFEKSRLVSLNEMAATGSVPGEWVYTKNRHIRFMAIDTDQASAASGQSMLAGGKLTDDLSSMPRLPRSYPEGEIFAYVIDFLNQDGGIAFRAYYQDAVSHQGMGYLPDFDKQDQAPVDVALMAVTGFNKVDTYPFSILRNVQPKQIVAIRWENINRSQADPVREAASGDLEEFQKRVRIASQAPVKVPSPGASIAFRVQSGSDAIQTAAK
ncbi:hypothetical protein ABWL39_03930 [Chitinivorax sp. PXF-14]|uniref:hypothetical protein n=1 Tax=Chitinivorax sp. PXF-14 TaxID=3230488 RepID=UPI0034674B6C